MIEDVLAAGWAFEISVQSLDKSVRDFLAQHHFF